MFQELVGVPFTLVSFLVAFSVVVFVHELGHFLVARRCGVRCESFSIGLGRELFGYTDRLGTRWKFSLIPIGGYVKMYGESETMQAIEGGKDAEPREMTPEEKAQSLQYKTVGQRAAVVFAGPAANFIFAILVFFTIYLIAGRSIIEPLVGTIIENSAAAESGLMTGDRIVAIDNREVNEFEDISWRLMQLGNDQPMNLTVMREGERIEVNITPRLTEVKDASGNVQKIPMLGFEPLVEPVVGGVVGNGAAANAGVKAGDRVVAIDRHEVKQFDDIKRFVLLGQGGQLVMTVLRDGQRVDMTMTPRMEETKDSAGIEQKSLMLGIFSADRTRTVDRFKPIPALNMAFVQTYRVVETTGIALGQMIARKRGTEGLGGPIGIAQVAGQAARQGLGVFVQTMAFLSISLGLINLFPVPLLDGGHLLFYAIEAVRGRPLSERVQEWGMRIGIVLVGSLMLFAIGNDLLRRVWPLVRGLAT